MVEIVVALVLFQISGVHHGWVCKVPENNSAVGTNNIRGESLPQASVVHIGTLRVLSVRGDFFHCQHEQSFIQVEVAVFVKVKTAKLWELKLKQLHII